MFTSGVLPGTDAGLGLPGMASAGRLLEPLARGTGPGSMDGVITPVLPAPPVGASCSAKAGAASIMASVAERASFVRVICPSVRLKSISNGRQFGRFGAAST
ncbi:hypothetical protein ASF26_01465 [Methylobacterium sp. Leaf93]|nr:hypothetical protein ASF26_01465 [Methylobacterium sp. Leaf93]